MKTERNQRRTGKAGAALRLSLLPLCTVLMAGPVAAFELEDCETLPFSDWHHGDVDFVDYGRGMISYRSFASFPNTPLSGSLNILSCFDATHLRVGLYAEAWEQMGRDAYDVSDDVMALFGSLVEADQSYTLPVMRALFQETSPFVSIRELAHEPCACRIAYPHGTYFEHRFDLENAPGAHLLH